MADRFDLIVIGTGTAGETVAFKCLDAGMKVAIIDKRPFGGTCALRGCDPKKVLLGAAEAVARARDLSGRGITGDTGISWPVLMRFKTGFTESVPAQMENVFIEAGIESFHGTARFTSPESVAVDGRELWGDHIVIAAGARPRTLHIPGEEYLATSEDVLSMESIPGHIIFIGGGYISCELAHVVARAGADVTILNRSNRLLRRFDGDLVDMLMEYSRSLGIDIQINLPLHSIAQKGDGYEVRAGKEGEYRFTGDCVVHGAGRVPDIDDLRLDAAGVAVDERGIVLNTYLQSVTNPGVYVAGDAHAQGIALTPVATMEAGVVAANIIEGNSRTPDYSVVPSVAYTVPPVASVGLSEEQARHEGRRFVLHMEDTRTWDSTRRLGLGISGYKIIIEEDSGLILGAHLLGHNADEVINLFAMAMHTATPADDLRNMMWAYPTATSDIRYML